MANPPQNRVFYLCPSHNHRQGGIKVMYQHVDLLSRNGFSAFILHEKTHSKNSSWDKLLTQVTKRKFRCSWFENQTPLKYLPTTKIRPTDIIVLPEIHGSQIIQTWPKNKKVILNQNHFLTFTNLDRNIKASSMPYLDPQVLGTITISPQITQSLKSISPRIKIFEVPNSINPEIFIPQTKKKNQIAYVVKKYNQDAQDILNRLKASPALKGWKIFPIQGRSEIEMAKILQKSKIFLNFSTREGFGLPPAEAMACGCLVIGYTGQGGEEFFKPEFSYPIPEKDISQFSHTIEKVVVGIKKNPSVCLEKGFHAAKYIHQNYSPSTQKNKLCQAWSKILIQAKAQLFGQAKKETLLPTK